jgi:CheY-like chemotaxis protein
MSVTDRSAPIEILLVEDNPDDVTLTVEALNLGKVWNNLSVARDGVEALDFLHRAGRHADAPVPEIILLDLNLPRKDGREVLAEIKADEELRHIPVVILTTSQAEQDILKSYQLHANCYVTKPVDFDEFIEIVHSIEDFWFTVVKLPGGARVAR